MFRLEMPCVPFTPKSILVILCQVLSWPNHVGPVTCTGIAGCLEYKIIEAQIDAKPSQYIWPIQTEKNQSKADIFFIEFIFFNIVKCRDSSAGKVITVRQDHWANSWL